MTSLFTGTLRRANGMNEALSIGIIGGADGPTAVFVTGGLPWGAIIAVLGILGACIWFYRRK